MQGSHRIEACDRSGQTAEAVLELKYPRILLLPQVAKQQQYQPVEVTVIHSLERGTPKNRERLEWKLQTDLSVETPDEAVEKVQWYALRSKIAGLPQSTQFGLPRRAVRPAHRRATRPTGRGLLYPQMAHLLVDHDQLHATAGCTHGRAHATGTARPTIPREKKN